MSTDRTGSQPIPEVAVLLLAAGGSRRLGHPKQLLPYRGKNLLQYAIDECVAAGVGPVILVLGAHAPKIQQQIDQKEIETLINPNWEAGMSTSIAFGVRHLLSTRTLDGLIISMADQPFLTAGHLKELAQAVTQPGQDVVCAQYDEGAGPPCYFGADYFEVLSRLNGDTGAKQVVRRYRDRVRYISFPKGHIDIDRPEDIALLNPLS